MFRLENIIIGGVAICVISSQDAEPPVQQRHYSAANRSDNVKVCGALSCCSHKAAFTLLTIPLSFISAQGLLVSDSLFQTELCGGCVFKKHLSPWWWRMWIALWSLLFTVIYSRYLPFSCVRVEQQAGVLSDKSLVATKKTGSLETGPTLHDQNKWEGKKKTNKNLSCDVMGGMEMSNVRCSQDLCCSVPAALFFGKCCNPQSHKHEMGERSDASWPSDWEKKSHSEPFVKWVLYLSCKKEEKQKTLRLLQPTFSPHWEPDGFCERSALAAILQGFIFWSLVLRKWNEHRVCLLPRQIYNSIWILFDLNSHCDALDRHLLISHLKNNVGTSHVSSSPGQGTTHFLSYSDCSCVVLIKKTTKQNKNT